MTPEIIVLDEPTTTQDPTSLKGIMNLMMKEYQTITNILMIIHDVDLVDQVANRIIVLSKSKIITDAKTDDIFINTEILKKSNLKAPVRV
ncbi:MAG: hypothetical protein ACFFFH_05915 [Candidatus Thorarchaeota archaeon]